MFEKLQLRAREEAKNDAPENTKPNDLKSLEKIYIYKTIMTYIKLNDKDVGINKIKEKLAQNNENLDGMMKKLKIARTTFEILSNRDRV